MPVQRPNISGNAGTATKLQTARTIGGTSFDGSANIDPNKLATAAGSAPSYSARAWANFSGIGVEGIRNSGNVTSLTDNGVGDFTVNFTTAMPHDNYSVIGTASSDSAAITIFYVGGTEAVLTVDSCRVQTATSGGAAADRSLMSLAVFC